MVKLLSLCQSGQVNVIEVGLTLLSRNMLNGIEIWEHLSCVVIEELVGRTEFVRDGFDALLGDEATEEGCKRVENTLSLE